MALEKLLNSSSWKETAERLRQRQEYPNDRELNPGQRVTLKCLGYEHFGKIAPLLCTETGDEMSSRLRDKISTTTEAALVAIETAVFDKLNPRELAMVAAWQSAIRYRARKLMAATEYPTFDVRTEYSQLLNLFDHIKLL